MEAPGDCSPSLSVVSKIKTVSDMTYPLKIISFEYLINCQEREEGLQSSARLFLWGTFRNTREKARKVRRSLSIKKAQIAPPCHQKPRHLKVMDACLKQLQKT
jgi:hypothetical protein